MNTLTNFTFDFISATLLIFLLGCVKTDKQKELSIANNSPAQAVHYDKNYSCAEVRKIASEVLAISADSIQSNSKLIDLGIAKNVDDIRYMEIVMHVEAKFEIEIPDNQAKKFKTIGELCDYIEETAK